jgi:hypothetical protein
MYLLGFETGFNSEAEGVYDIFETLGPEPSLQALYAIEPWCASNPDKTFGKAVIALSVPRLKSTYGHRNGRHAPIRLALRFGGRLGFGSGICGAM